MLEIPGEERPGEYLAGFTEELLQLSVRIARAVVDETHLLHLGVTRNTRCLACREVLLLRRRLGQLIGETCLRR